MLDPLPIHFDEDQHSYLWKPTNEVMCHSISEVVKPMSEQQRKWLEDHPYYAERGSSVHLSLEEFHLGHPFTDLETYSAWTDKLLHASWWDDVEEVIAIEHRLADPKRSIGGSFDGLVRRRGATCLYDLKTKEEETSRRDKPLAQLGAYSEMLALHYRDLPDEVWVIWSYQGGVDFEQLDLQKCLDAWEGAWVKHLARQEEI